MLNVEIVAEPIYLAQEERGPGSFAARPGRLAGRGVRPVAQRRGVDQRQRLPGHRRADMDNSHTRPLAAAHRPGRSGARYRMI